MDAISNLPDELMTVLKSRYQELVEHAIYMDAIMAELGAKTAAEALELVRSTI